MIFLGITTILSLVITGIITAWYYTYFKYNQYYSKYKGPPNIPVLGSTYKIFSNSDTIPVFMEYIKKYGRVIKMWFGFRPWIIIADYKTAEILLCSSTIIDKSYVYKFFEPWLGTGLLTGGGLKWKRQRKILNPSFHAQILEKNIAIFNAQGDVLIEVLQKHAGVESLDIRPCINLCALDIISEAAMGIQIHAQKGNAVEYVDAVTKMLEILIARMFSPITSNDFLFKFSGEYKKHQRALDVLHGQTNYVIACKQKELAAVAKEDDENNSEGKKRLAFLDLLLQCRIDGEPLALEDIREEVDTFMFAGHDTTTAGICFTLYCLSQNLEVQIKAVEELNGIFNHDKYRSPTQQELNQMKYLEMIIKESMRLYPPVPLTSRSLPKTLEFDGTTLMEGSSIGLFIYGLHRQEELFPNPEKFDPERFSAVNSLGRSPFSYVPFSAGPRNCIGQRFAMLAMKSIVSKVLRHFEILPAPGYKPRLTSDAVLSTNNGILLNLKERNA